MTTREWWKSSVMYQIYPRSFRDSNGDGVGDIRGIIEKLDYLQWLGIGMIWLCPTYPSPNADFGYDIADYYGVHPEFGTISDMETLIVDAHARGIHILLDLVPNHTSDENPWFVDARTSRDAVHRDWYVFADGKGDGPPNNWLDVVDACAWIFEPNTNQWYLHNFLPSQPDLNWWNPDVRAAFEDILRFWFDRGVAGFRIDVAHGVIKDKLLRDNPTDPPILYEGQNHRTKQRQVYNAHQPEVHEIYRTWRKIAQSYDPERLFYGETKSHSTADTVRFYGEDDELHLTLNGPALHIAGTMSQFAHEVQEVETTFPPYAWPSWAGSNHDHPRFPTRWAHGSREVTRCYLFILLTIRGTPVLYYGDEIGMEDVPMDKSQWKDPMHSPGKISRDPCRTPMPWNSTPGGGFTTPDVHPWLPLGDPSKNSVQTEREDLNSILHLTRRIIHFRSTTLSFTLGTYTELFVTDTCWMWQRGEGYLVCINIAPTAATLNATPGTIVLATTRDLEGMKWDGTTIPPKTGFVIQVLEQQPGQIH